jgi:hypothetical protein
MVRAAIARRFEDECGVALLMALGVLIVLTVLVLAMLEYTSSGQRSARFTSARTSASDLAEAGINDGLSVLATVGVNTSTVKPQPQYAGDPNSTIETFQAGTVTWGASFDYGTATWTIKAIGSVKNPSGPAAANPIRTLTATAQVVPPPYSFASLNAGCDKHTLLVTLGGQLTVTNGIYTNSCNSSHDAFDVKGSGGSISAPTIEVVGGWERASDAAVVVNGVNCPLQYAYANTAPTTGCPTVGQPSIGDPFAGKVTAPALSGTPACTGPVYGTAASYSGTHPKLAANINSSQTVITVVGTNVQTGDVVQIDSEQMLVTAGGGTTTLTVQRPYNGTSTANHNKDKELKLVPVTGTEGTASTPGACDISSGTVTLNPGTYYGGLCIGSNGKCGSNVGGSCTTSSTSTANVILNPGTYIMAGGGFFVCGSSTLSAPNVLIYNTQDPSNTSGAGAIDQILLNTTGSVSLGPQTSGDYKGLTIFQDRDLVVDTADLCDKKNGNQTTKQDIAFYSMASTGANGALGSVSGTIYAPADTAIFADAVSGTANLAILTGCLAITAATSTFAFDTSGLYSSELQLLGQSG